ncbi:MAG: ComF family protein [Chloroflexi bacterium]|nr:ComF family protein [Chloroflexota bacterium]
MSVSISALTVRTGLSQMKESLLDLLFPRRCAGCGKEGDFLCAACSNTLAKLEAPVCARCGFPMKGRNTCPDCGGLALAIDGIRSPYLHEGLARDLVHSLKYNNLKALSRPVARLMAKYLESNPLPADSLMAVPIHSKRMRKRGYNQSELVTGELSRLAGLPRVSGALIRLRNTPSQVKLGAHERRANVAGAFVCRDRAVEGKRVLLIDDVCTTGATLNACAAALKEAGAVTVWGLTFSREC